MKHEATRELFTYWNGLRGARAAPERCDIDPTAIRTILADTFMLDVDSRFPVRLAGTRVAALLGTERTVPSFLDLWRPEERHNLAAVLLSVADRASPIVVGAAGAARGQPECAFEVLFLPLRHYGKTHARILGIATPAQSPSWLGMVPVEPLTMRSLRILDAEAAPPCRSSERSPSRFSAHDAIVTPHAADDLPTAAGRLIALRPALRLIEGGRAG